MSGFGIKRPGWLFYPAWVGVSIFSIFGSWFATFLIIVGVANWFGRTIQVNGQTRAIEDFLFLYVFFTVFCLLSGVLQYLLLRRHLPKMGGWVSATMAGCVLVFAGMALMQQAFTSNFLFLWNGVLAFAMIGGMIGLSQWVLLRRRLPKAGVWVLASVVGWGFGVLGRFAAEVNGNALVQLLVMILPPAIAACAAWWYLLRHQRKKPKRQRAG